MLRIHIATGWAAPKVEQHAVVVRQTLAEHQATGSLGGRHGELDLELEATLRSVDHERAHLANGGDGSSALRGDHDCEGQERPDGSQIDQPSVVDWAGKRSDRLIGTSLCNWGPKRDCIFAIEILGALY